MAMVETLIAGLLGGVVAATIGGVVNLRIEGKRHAAALAFEQGRQNEERRKDELRFRRDRLVEPIIVFTDDLLACISETYWTGTERATGDLSKGEDERLSEVFRGQLIHLRNRELGVQARVFALNDPGLKDAFEKLSFQLINVRHEAANGIGAARDEATKASIFGAVVLDAVCKVQAHEHAPGGGGQ